MLLDLLLFILIIVLIGGFATGFVIFYTKFKGHENLLIKKTLETSLLQNQLRLEVERRAAGELDDNDGFIKFLSQSRDWAFGYIENVQELIKTLQAAVIANDQSAIAKAQEDLFKELPEEESK